MSAQLEQQPEENYSAVAEAVRLSKYDPVWFRKNILRAINDTWQDDLLNAVADFFRKRDGIPTLFNHEGLNRFTVRSGHGPGKTTVVAQLMHWLGFTRYGIQVCTATKFKQITTRLWPCFRALRAAAIDEYRPLMEVTAERITWANDLDWCAIPETATQPENLQGFHPLAFFIDEASGIAQELFPVIEGALSGGNTILFMIGNPTQNRGEFYDSHCDAQVSKLYHRVHVRPEQSSHMKPLWVTQVRDRYGENSPVYKVRVLGEFVENAENQLLSLGWIMAALERAATGDGTLPKLRVAVDVADGGVDETVLDASHMYDTKTVFLRMERHSFPPSESPIMAADAAERLFYELGGRKGIDEFVVDALGVGAGTAGTLMMRGHAVICYKGGESSSNPTLWRNRRVQSYLVLRNEFRDGRIAFAEHYTRTLQDTNDMIAQLCWIRTKPGIERVEDLETKQELVRDSGKSPDLADTKAMMFATQAPSFTGQAYQPPAEALGQTEAHSADAYLT